MEPTSRLEASLKPRVSMWRRHRAILLIVALVLLADQLTKWVVSATMELGKSIPDEGIARITYTYNTGGAFGLFRDQTFFLILASVVGVGVLVWFYRSHPHPGLLFKLSLGLQLGGALGNLANRVIQGRVVDFIDLGWWPVFNLADASIVTGIFTLAFLFHSPQSSKRPHTAMPPDPEGNQ